MKKQCSTCATILCSYIVKESGARIILSRNVFAKPSRPSKSTTELERGNTKYIPCCLEDRHTLRNASHNNSQENNRLKERNGAQEAKGDGRRRGASQTSRSRDVEESDSEHDKTARWQVFRVASAQNGETKGKVESESEWQGEERIYGESREAVEEEGAEAAPEDLIVAAVGSHNKTVVVEHCKQCNSFKTRAFQVRDGLEEGVPGIRVLLNPVKPRSGCFEIREEGGEKFTSLLDMKRPFKPMKDLDMEKVISDIIDKINEETMCA